MTLALGGFGAAALATATAKAKTRLELSRADITRRLLVAHVPAHREILSRALCALDEQIAHLR